MAQVSGGGGGAAFNGGTITQPLTVATGSTVDTLTLTNTDGTTAHDLIDATALHTTFRVDCDGEGFFRSDDGVSFTVEETAGNDAALVVKSTTKQAIVRASDGVSSVGGSLRVTDIGGLFARATLSQSAFITRYNAAPADGDLAAGDCALWLDATNGAAKLMVKAKQADGTVRTGSLALT